MNRIAPVAVFGVVLAVSCPARADPPRGVGLAFFSGEVQRSTAEGITSGMPIGLDVLARYGWLQGGFVIADQFDAHPFAINEAATTLGVMLGPAVPISDTFTIDVLAVGGRHTWSNATGNTLSSADAVTASLPFVGARAGVTARSRGTIHWIGGLAFFAEDDLERRTASTSWTDTSLFGTPTTTHEHSRSARLGGVVYGVIGRIGIEYSF